MLISWLRLRLAVTGLAAHFLAFKLLSQLTLEASLFSRLHIEGVFLDFLNDAFLLNLTLKAPKGALHGLTFKHPNLGQICLRKVCDRAVSMNVPYSQSNTSFSDYRFMSQKNSVARAALLQAGANALHLNRKPAIAKALLEFSIFASRPDGQHPANQIGRAHV